MQHSKTARQTLSEKREKMLKLLKWQENDNGVPVHFR